jgi:hypothetical protein
MRYVISLRSSLKFLRCSSDPQKIAVFTSYEAADGVACRIGLDAEVLEIALYL